MTTHRRNYAVEFKIDYEQLLDAIKDYNETGEAFGLWFDTPDAAFSKAEEMWFHYEIVTGNVARDRTAPIFTCSC